MNNKKCRITKCLNTTVSYCRMTRDVHSNLKIQNMKIRVAVKPIHIFFTRKRSILTIEILIFCQNVNWDCCKDYILTIWRRYSFCLIYAACCTPANTTTAFLHIQYMTKQWLKHFTTLYYEYQVYNVNLSHNMKTTFYLSHKQTSTVGSFHCLFSITHIT